ncbi:ABC transporter permease [Actinomadura viridis]|uniref:ABC transporter permease n=1 Tax=Actinomadura viridis TaxID=58110 RepID=UPI0036C3385F
MNAIVAAEWIKLRSVRSTCAALGVALALIVAGVLITWQAMLIWDGLSPERRSGFGLAQPADLTAWAGSLSLGVLGVLSVGAEYRGGMIRTTFAVMPGRTAVLAAKARLVGAVALAAGQALTLVTFLGTRLVIGDRPVPGHRTAIAQELPELLLRGCTVAVYAVLGVALAVLLRSTAAAIIGLVVPWYPLPILGNLLPGPWGERLGSFLPDALPEQILGEDNANSVYGGLLPPWAAAVVMVAYVVVPLLAAALVLSRRDA